MTQLNTDASLPANHLLHKYLIFSLFALLNVQFGKAGTSSNFENAIGLQATISGTVTDDQGIPLPGASVIVKNTQNGTQTDFDGNFELVAEDDDVLVISYIGFVTNEVSVDGRSTLNVQLETDTGVLDEVVVIGYGSQKKEAVTGAVSTVSSEDVAALPVVSFAEALQGRVPGVQVNNSGGPGTNPIVRIRGIGSISFSSNPLYVVDGYPTGGLGDFDNNDIDNISVLKDASAAAIYGSRAANGVVLVTTKRGRASNGVEFNYKGFSGFAQASKKLDLLKREQYLQFGAELIGNAGGTLPSRWSNLDEPIYEGADQTYAETDEDYQDAAFKTGLTSSHHLSVRGGSEQSRFFGSFGYFSQEGIIVGTGFNRYNIRVNSDHDIIKDRLTIGQSLTISDGERTNEAALGGRTQIQNIIRGVPYIPLRDPTLPGGLRAPDGTDGTDPENPLRGGLIDTNVLNRVRIFGTAYADLKITDALSYRFTAGVNWTNSRNRQQQPIYFDGFKGRNVNISIDNQSTSRSNYFSNQLNYLKTWGDHNLDVVAVAERQDFDGYSLRGQGERFSNDINVLTGTEAQVVRGNVSENVIYSYLARANYDFGGKYLLSASLRRDGSSKFAEGFKWKTFPGVSVGWNIAKEGFMEGFDKLTELKLRASWGQMGFEGIGNFESQAGISTNTNAIINNQEAQGAFFNRLANPELEWEITEMTNVGLDMTLFQGRVQLTTEWYQRKTDNLILSVPVPSSLGFSDETIANVGGMENWGIDLQTTYYSRPDTEFQWNISGNLGLFRNEVTALSTDTGTIFGGRNQDAGGTDITRTAPGDAIQSYFGWRVEGIFQSQSQIDEFNAIDGDATTPYQANAAPGDIIFKDLDGSGDITASDREVLGTFIPDFTYGLNFDADYKNFYMKMYWFGNQGNDVYNVTKVFTQGGLRLFNHGVAALDAWTPENTDTSIPRMVAGDPNQNTRTSDRFVEDASFLRLQNLKIGYKFPAEWLERNMSNTLSNMKFYVSGNNLLTFTGYTGYDPEIGARNNNLVQGIDYGQYPRPLTILMGVEVGF